MSAIQQMFLSGGGGDTTLIEAITLAGLTANLQLCLDAGDPVSYASGTKWLDRSGGGYDFFLGSDGSGTSDPTFVGSIGSPAAYWTGPSGYFTYDTTNEAWMNNLHKNNAAFTCIHFMYQAGTFPVAFGTNGGTDAGIGVQFQTATSPRIGVAKGSAGYALVAIGDTTPSANAYHMVGVSLNEATGAGGGFIYTDGAYNKVGGADTFNSTYTSPSAAAATYAMNVGAYGGGLGNLDATERLVAIAIWSSALTKANMDAIWSAMRGRFGI